MVLTDLQRSVLLCLADNRSKDSYYAGGAILNLDQPRLSDDLDIFHDSDEGIGAAAQRDIETLRAKGYSVRVDVNVFGCVEATVSRYGQQTMIQWMSETRQRFFPVIRHPDFGFRLHPLDLAVNKMIAASTRTKARDFVDLLTIEECGLAPLAALALAAAGKAPFFSPQRSIDEIRRRGLSIGDGEYTAVRGIAADLTPAIIRERLIALCDRAELILSKAPSDTVGLLLVTADGRRAVTVTALPPVEPNIVGRKATTDGLAVPRIWSTEDPDFPVEP